jgi:hypothetical protein
MLLTSGIAGVMRVKTIPFSIPNVDQQTEVWADLCKLKERGGPLFLLFKGRLLLLQGYRLRGKIHAIMDWNKFERPLIPKPIFTVETHEVETLGAEHLLEVLYENGGDCINQS